MKPAHTSEEHIRETLRKRFKYIDLDHELGRVLYEEALRRALAKETPKK